MITVTLGDGWRRYQSATMRGMTMLGVVTLDSRDPGALAQSQVTGLYLHVSDGHLHLIDQDEVKAAIQAAESRAGRRGGSGRGQGRKTADNAVSPRPRTVMLSDADADAAIAHGDGNLSLGVRRAISLISGRQRARGHETG